MEILLVGLNYRTAPVEVRECFSVPDDVLHASLDSLSMRGAVGESVILSTCNRTEIYVATEDRERAASEVVSFLSGVSRLPASEFREHLYTGAGFQAVRHLLKVVSGLDSMVLGETQILGQVRGAFLSAQSQGHTGPVFNHLFREAIAFGKRVQTETEIGQSAVSVSYAAVSLARKVFGGLAAKTALVIGAGKMSELTLTHLTAHGVNRIFVVNRNLERAREVAERFGGVPLPMTRLSDALRDADIVISSTGAKGYVVTQELASGAMKRRRQRPLFFIDIAVPRDIDPAAGRLGDVYLYDIDDLQDVVTSNVSEREREAARVLEMIEEETGGFAAWLAQQQVVPLIARLRERGQEVRQSVMESLVRKLPGLDEHTLKVLEKHTQSIVNQLLREPIASAKQMAEDPDRTRELELFARIFGLEYTSPQEPRDGDVDVPDGGAAREAILQPPVSQAAVERDGGSLEPPSRDALEWGAAGAVHALRAL